MNSFSSFELTASQAPTKEGAIAVLEIGKNKYNFTCDSEKNPITCKSKNQITEEGTFTLTSITGTDKFEISELEDKTLLFESESISQEQNTSPVVKASNPSFTINLQSKDSSMPSLYIDEEGTQKLNHCTKNAEDAFIVCTPTKEDFTSSDNYEIYYSAPCNIIKSTGIIVNYTMSKTIEVTAVYLENKNKCQNNAITSFIIELSEDPTEDKINAVLKNSYSFSCSISGTILTCSTEEQLAEGSYTLTNVNGDTNYYDISKLSSRTLQYKKEYLDTQTKTVTIDKNNFSFAVELSSSGTSVPIIYVGGDENKKEIKCSKNEQTLTCTPTDNEMPETKEYAIYYQGACGDIKSTGITVNHILTSTINVLSFSLEGDSVCSSSPITSFKVTISSVPKGSVSYAILTNINDSSKTYNFTKCEAEGKTITCNTPSPAIAEGAYTISLIEGIDTYILTKVETKKITYTKPVNPFTSIISPQIVTSEQPTFKLTLSSADTSLPYIYVGGEIIKTKKVSCTQSSTNLTEVTCTPNSKNMPEKGSYELYYVGACGELFPIRLTVQYTPPAVITITSLNTQCKKEPFTEITFTIDNDPTGAITIVILTKEEDSSSFIFSHCTVSLQSVTCNQLSKPLEKGTYKLTSIAGADSYIISNAVSNTLLKYVPEALGKQIVTNPTINDNNPSFNVILADEYTEIPKFISSIAVACVKDNNNQTVAVCTFKESLPRETTSIDIFYQDECGKVISTGISVKVSYENIDIVNVTFSNEAVCITEKAKEIIITVNKEPTGSISEAIISNENEDEFYFDNCKVDEKIIKCSTEQSIREIGIYKFISLKGVDIYTVDKVKDIELEIKEFNEVLGEQVQEQVLKNDNLNFTIYLASEEITAPEIYVSEDKMISCVKNEEKLICTPDKKIMPNKEEYEIFYKDNCGNLVSTGVTVTNMINEIDVEDNNGNYAVYNKIIISLLFIFLL